jgi:very-short-patch-repair endonuclease
MGSEANPPRSRGGEPRSGGGGVPTLRRQEVYTARKLRRNLSLPEALLWNQLKGKKLGLSFRKQYPVAPYVADFYCAPKKLIIEIDGFAHDVADHPARDKARDQWMVSHGYSLLRILATDVLENMGNVLDLIAAKTDAPLHRFAVPLPVNGEDL